MDISLSFSLLLLGLLARASCETCLEEEDIAPCKCRLVVGSYNIFCYRVSLEEIEDVLPNLRRDEINTVHITEAKGDRLSSFLFYNTKVRRINILDCDLQGLSDNDRRPAFVGLEYVLQYLSVVNSIKGDNQLKKLDLSHLDSLRNIYLYQNNIPEVGNDWFAHGPYRLSDVTIVSCGVRKLGDKAFAALDNLLELHLRQNSLTSIDRSMIRNPANHLETVDLEYNNFTSFSNDIFSEMPSLRTVHLKDNSIRRIEEATWSPVWEQLNLLDLENNPLECDSHMEWMFSLKTPKVLLGTCDSPASVEGELLLNFIEINRTLLSLTGK